MHRNAVIVLKWFIKCVKKKCWYSQTNIMEKTGLNVKRFNSFIEYSILYVKKIDTVYNSVISDLHGHLDEFWSPSTTPRGSHGVFLILVNAKSSFAEYWGNIAITLCDYFSLFSGAQHKPHTYFKKIDLNKFKCWRISHTPKCRTMASWDGRRPCE